MANHTVRWIAETGKTTLNWFPSTRSLADWSSYKIAATERDAPNLGMYDAILDSTEATKWVLFDSSTQPSNWSDAISIENLIDEESSLTVESSSVRESSFGYGPKRVKTPNMEVEQFDPRIIQEVAARENAGIPNLHNLGFSVAVPNLCKYKRPRNSKEP